jgi:hypothetical protein
MVAFFRDQSILTFLDNPPFFNILKKMRTNFRNFVRIGNKWQRWFFLMHCARQREADKNTRYGALNVCVRPRRYATPNKTVVVQVTEMSHPSSNETVTRMGTRFCVAVPGRWHDVLGRSMRGVSKRDQGVTPSTEDLVQTVPTCADGGSKVETGRKKSARAWLCRLIRLPLLLSQAFSHHRHADLSRLPHYPLSDSNICCFS